jgi:hypothetical protein
MEHLTVALIGRYSKTKDAINNTENSEKACLLVLTNNMRFSL